ncbi:hypothetical protein [Euzebya pacifica]|uniref:hypothetical protein n=1 Tax=Euzebya pacifica TaxID=1608957 RepID=UPI001C20071C|nr:hypothetical protein [Euzebya pacifica]
MLPTPRRAADRTSRRLMVDADQWSAPSLAQVVELVQGILPREFRSWDEVPGYSRRFAPSPAPTKRQDPAAPTLFGDGGWAGDGPDSLNPRRGSRAGDEARHLPTPVVSDGNGSGGERQGSPNLNTVVELLPTPTVAAATGGQITRGGSRSDELLLGGIAEAAADGRLSSAERAAFDRISESEFREADIMSVWGPYAFAIARWEDITGVEVPEPTVTGKNGARRLSPMLVEWMLGLAPNFVTGVPGLSRRQQLRMLGNGVVPQQAAAAFATLIGAVLEEHADRASTRDDRLRNDGGKTSPAVTGAR